MFGKWIELEARCRKEKSANLLTLTFGIVHRSFVELRFRIAIRLGATEFSSNLSRSKHSKLKNSILVETIKPRTSGRLGKR